MVLLSASTVSVILSSGVICLFTFLLFLSGYILQRNAVDNLRSALEAPLDSRVRVQLSIPQTLPDDNEDTPVETDDTNSTTLGDVLEEIGLNPNTISTTEQIPINQNSQPNTEQPTEPTPQQLWHSFLDNTDPSSTPQHSQPPSQAATPLSPKARFAYVLSLPHPSDLCSALAFAASHRQISTLPGPQSNIIFLYPASWESSPTDLSASLLRLLLHAEHAHSVTLHPVPISKVWTGIDITQQLLSELARNPWPYDRLIYLRSPGMLLDAARLDDVLVSSFNDPGVVRREWTRLKPAGRGQRIEPDVLMFAQGKGLMVPLDADGDAASLAVGFGGVSVGGEVQRVTRARDAAYIVFGDGDLDGAGKESGVIQRFERDRRAACEGTPLLG